MATREAAVVYILDQAGLGGRLTARKMFGEYALYLDGKIVALVCDDELFLKPTAPGKALLGEVSTAPPYPGAKDHYRLVDEIDDPERLREALLVTAQVLPAPKPKTPKKRSAR